MSHMRKLEKIEREVLSATHAKSHLHTTRNDAFSPKVDNPQYKQ
jgi:hypothetical protein